MGTSIVVAVQFPDGEWMGARYKYDGDLVPERVHHYPGNRLFSLISQGSREVFPLPEDLDKYPGDGKPKGWPSTRKMLTYFGSEDFNSERWAVKTNEGVWHTSDGEKY